MPPVRHDLALPCFLGFSNRTITQVLQTPSPLCVPIEFGPRKNRMSIFSRDKTFAQPINLTITLSLAVFHVGAVVALFMFSWKALAFGLFMWWIAESLGIGMGFHRLLTHRGYKTPKWVEYFLTICGTLALQGGPIGWVATHRLHHQNSDKEGDPHSPRDGGFWAHMGWIITGDSLHNKSIELLPYVPELRKDKFMIWISEWHWVPLTTIAVITLLRWRMALRDVGNLPAHRSRPARHVSRELCHSPLGIAPIPDARRFHQQFLGRDAQLRRRLAQQSSRPSAVGASRTRMVRVRFELVRNLRA